MNGPAGFRHSRILGLGEQRPVRLITNHELPPALDTNDEWIQQRTGIATRGIAGDDETVITMASEAARKAVADAGVDPAQVGLVILATCSMPQPIPGGAAQVATVARCRPAPAPTTSTRRAPASATGWAPRPTRCASAPSTTPSSSAPRRSPTGSTGPTAPRQSCSATARVPSSSARPTPPASGRSVFGSDGSAVRPDRHDPGELPPPRRSGRLPLGHDLAR